MDEHDLAVKKFLLARDAIDRVRYPNAYRMAYKTPFKFYKEHSTEEAVAILIAEHEKDGD